MPRVLWKGSISFGLVYVPVGLYPAEQPKELSFNLLDKRDHSPVGYKRFNKNTQEEVPLDQIVKGYEYEDDQYVLMGDEDFRQANIKANETFEITDFVPLEQIAPYYFDKPYFLEPQKKGEKVYALLRDVLARTQKVGIGKVVLRNKEHLGALIAYDNVLILNLLRFGHEIRDIKNLQLPDKNAENSSISGKEMDMAQMLVESMSGDWKPEKYKDDYYDDVMKLIDEKVKTGRTEEISQPSKEEEPQTGKVLDLMQLLKRSVENKGTPEKTETLNKKEATPPVKKTIAKKSHAAEVHQTRKRA